MWVPVCRTRPFAIQADRLRRVSTADGSQPLDLQPASRNRVSKKPGAAHACRRARRRLNRGHHHDGSISQYTVYLFGVVSVALFVWGVVVPNRLIALVTGAMNRGAGHSTRRSDDGAGKSSRAPVTVWSCRSGQAIVMFFSSR